MNCQLEKPKQLLPDEVRIWCVSLAEAPKPLMEICLRLISPDEQLRADRFVFPALQHKYVLARGILRWLLGALCEAKPEELIFNYGHAGKPSLSRTPLPLEFNLSHSGDTAAYAFTLKDPIGIDIECRRDLKNPEDIAKHFFAPAEYQELMSIEGSTRETAFFNCWVRKEAYIKAVGGGLSIPLDSFRVSILPGQAAALLELQSDRDNANRWAISEFRPAADCFGAVASSVNKTALNYNFSSANEILELIG